MWRSRAGGGPEKEKARAGPLRQLCMPRPQRSPRAVWALRALNPIRPSRAFRMMGPLCQPLLPPPTPDRTETPQRLHAFASSLKIQTVERKSECLSRYAPFVDGMMPVASCSRDLVLRFPERVLRKRTLEAFVNGTITKCGVRKKMLVAFGNVSHSSRCPIKGRKCRASVSPGLKRMRAP